MNMWSIAASQRSWSGLVVECDCGGGGVALELELELELDLAETEIAGISYFLCLIL